MNNEDEKNLLKESFINSKIFCVGDSIKSSNDIKFLNKFYLFSIFSY